MKGSDNISSGKRGERIAAIFLEKQGYKILEMNFKARYGELDIIALDGKTLVFVEVKTRKTYEYGRPEEAVNPRKLHMVVQTGQYYKLMHPELPDLLRVDVVAVDLLKNTVRLIRNVTQ
ncbi:MAG: YraN family protein [bacterium]|nr:YraN family protein [bacterium]